VRTIEIAGEKAGMSSVGVHTLRHSARLWGIDVIGRAAFAARDDFYGISDRYISSTRPSDHSTRVP
jgi:hypothetical protein